MSSSTAQLTDFSLDILGRYLCNGFDEAMRSTDKNAGRPDGGPQSDARPFNAIIIGGGSFGSFIRATDIGHCQQSVSGGVDHVS